MALSSRSPALGITQQVWSFGSPDFPQIYTKANLQPPRLLSLLSSLILSCFLDRKIFITESLSSGTLLRKVELIVPNDEVIGNRIMKYQHNLKEGKIYSITSALILGLSINGFFVLSTLAEIPQITKISELENSTDLDSLNSLQVKPYTPEPQTFSQEAGSTINTNERLQELDSFGLREIDKVSGVDNPMNQIPAVRKLKDVYPTDWAFQALQALVEKYDCISGYPNNSYGGNRNMTRYEFAAGLNDCLDRMQDLLTAQNGDLSQKEDLTILQKLQEEFTFELAILRGRVDAIEARTAELEAYQFSATTKLFGISIVGVQGRSSNRADRSPRDGIRDRADPGTNINLINLNYLTLTTSFNSRSSLFIGLGEIKGSGAPRLTNDDRLAYDFFGDTNGLIFIDLNYRFLLGNKFAGFVGTEGINMINSFRGPNRIESAGTGPLSFFAQRNPILNTSLGRGGFGFDWQFSKGASLQAVYSTTIPGFFANSTGGQGHNTAGVQIALTPTDTVDLTLYYVNDYSPSGSLISFVGDEQLTATNPNTNDSESLQTNAVGATLTWQISPRLTLGGWAGYTNSYIPGESGKVETTNYMVFLNFLDLFGERNIGGLYVGQPPKIINSNLPDGNNIPDFFDTGLGRSGGQPGTTTHLEAFYRWQVTDNISLTPGVILIFEPGHSPDSDTIAIGALRTTFTF